MHAKAYSQSQQPTSPGHGQPLQQPGVYRTKTCLKILNAFHEMQDEQHPGRWRPHGASTKCHVREEPPYQPPYRSAHDTKFRSFFQVCLASHKRPCKACVNKFGSRASFGTSAPLQGAIRQMFTGWNFQGHMKRTRSDAMTSLLTAEGPIGQSLSAPEARQLGVESDFAVSGREPTDSQEEAQDVPRAR